MRRIFGEHVSVLDSAVGGSSGAVVGEDLFGPAADVPGKTGQFGNLGVGAVDVEADHRSSSAGLVCGGVNVSEELFSHPGGSDLTIGIADLEQRSHPGEPFIAETSVARQQDPTGPIQRVGLAAPMSQRLVLDAAADSSMAWLASRMQ